MVVSMLPLQWQEVEVEVLLLALGQLSAILEENNMSNMPNLFLELRKIS
jgi:hypothetical protein